jgi:hypothetical protein
VPDKALSSRQAQLRELEGKLVAYRAAVIKLLEDSNSAQVSRDIIEREFINIRLTVYSEGEGEKAVTTLENALSLHRNLIVLGNAGTGKSTLLRSLAAGAARGRLRGVANVPVLLDLSSGAPSTILSGVLFQIQHLGVALQEAELHLLLARGQLLLLIDGIDAVLSRHEVLNQVQAVALKYPKVHIVLATRPLQLPELHSFVKSEILPLSDAEAKRLLDVLAPELGIDAEQFWSVVQTSPGLRTLVQHPVKMRLLLDTYQREASYDHGTCHLINRSTELFFDRSRLNLSGRQRELAESIASHLTACHRTITDLDTIQHSVLSWQNERYNHADLRSLQQCGILQTSGDYGRVQFRHVVLQEYFAAEAFRELPSRNLLQLCQEHAADDWWQPVLLTAVWRRKDADKIIKALSEAANPKYRIFAARLLVEGAVVPRETRTHVLQTTCENFQAGSSDLIKETADVLARFTSEEAKEHCLKVLRKLPPSSLGSICLAYALAAQGSREDEVLEALLRGIRDPDPVHRSEACRGLGKLDTVRSIKELIYLLKSEQDITVYVYILSALEQSSALYSDQVPSSTIAILLHELEQSATAGDTELKARVSDISAKLAVKSARKS